MQTRLSLFIPFLLYFFIHDSFAQESVIAEPGLFRDAGRPLSAAIPFPDNSGFVTINQAVYNAANLHNPEIFTIENFPLGSERVTLHVEQFDVIRKDSKLVMGTKNGDVPCIAPTHILLHGTVEGKENSHVYIAVFNGYAMGYIDASPDERYLIQPVQLSSDVASTMIVYKENDIIRTIPQGEKWKCGTEEYAPNFPQIGKISQEMIKTAQIPEIQSQRMVHLLNIAIDCDYGFYQANGSDLTGAQNYAIAVLGAHSDIYIRDLNCGVSASYLRVWTTADSYSDNGNTTSDMLPAFVDYWNNNMVNVTNTAAMLYSNHGGGGLAYVGTMCNADGSDHEYAVCGLNTGYVFPNDGYIWDVDVSAHEFGHICGSLHTFNCSWNPPIDSCVAAEGGNCYSGSYPRKGTIMSYCHLTAFGTELKFHPRVAAFLKTRLNTNSIIPCVAFVEMPEADAGPDQVICPGSSVSIGGDLPGGIPPYSYSWRPNTALSATNTEVVTANPSQTTTYITSVTDGNMLRSYDTVTVFVQKPIVNAGGDVTVCGVGTFTLNGSAKGYPPFSYQWMDTAAHTVIGTQAQINVPVVNTKTYKLTVTDSVGCIGFSNMTITVAQKPTVLITPLSDTSICSEGSVTLSASGNAANYLWSNGKRANSITVSSAGSYYCIASNSGSGCDDTSRVVKVSVYPPAAVPVISQVGNAIFSTSAVSYQWYEGTTMIGGATSQKFTPANSGIYIVKTTNENGCSTTSQGFVFTAQSGVADNRISSNIRLYPNPAKDQLIFDYSLAGSLLLELSITDLQGNTVYRILRKPGEIPSLLVLDIRSFAQGTYFVHYSFGEGYSVLKFVKE